MRLREAVSLSAEKLDPLTTPPELSKIIHLKDTASLLTRLEKVCQITLDQEHRLSAEDLRTMHDDFCRLADEQAADVEVTQEQARGETRLVMTKERRDDFGRLDQESIIKWYTDERRWPPEHICISTLKYESGDPSARAIRVSSMDAFISGRPRSQGWVSQSVMTQWFEPARLNGAGNRIRHQTGYVVAHWENDLPCSADIRTDRGYATAYCADGQITLLCLGDYRYASQLAKTDKLFVKNAAGQFEPRTHNCPAINSAFLYSLARGNWLQA